MKILISSYSFYPNIGGSEVNANVLASEFYRSGHQVKIITKTECNNKSSDDSIFAYRIIRNPSFYKKLKLVKWCDIYFHNGISLRDAWPLIIIKRPWVIRHQTYLRSTKIKNKNHS